MTAPVFDRAEAVRLYRAGLNLREVAEVVGASHEAVRRGLHAAGVTLRESTPPAWTDAEIAILKPLYAAGETYPAIAAALKGAGFSRSDKGVEAQVRKLELGTRRAAPPRRQEAARSPSQLAGFSIEKDARFVRLLLEEQLRMVRAAKQSDYERRAA